MVSVEDQLVNALVKIQVMEVGMKLLRKKNGSHETKACGCAAQERTGESREGFLEATQRAIGCGDEGIHAQASHCLEEKIGAEGRQDCKSTRPQSGGPLLHTAP